MTVRIIEADCIAALPMLAADSLDCCVTDPPYELGFMGKKWDNTGVAFRPETWAAVYRVLKPGAHLLAFGGTRTHHRMTCAIEDAGFEIRDCIMFLFGTGFPKSHNLPGGLGTALKPAYEPIIVARKPLARGNTVAANVLQFGTGALNIDASRIPGDKGWPASRAYAAGKLAGTCGDADFINQETANDGAGRWPANVIHDGSPEVLDAFAAYGESKSSAQPRNNGDFKSVAKGHDKAHVTHGHSDAGTAARFFYSAKANASDRADSKHPTVKPLSLMRYLVRMVTPPAGCVLDPFAGTGSTGLAAAQLGMAAVLIEQSAEYAADVRAKLHGDLTMDAHIAAWCQSLGQADARA